MSSSSLLYCFLADSKLLSTLVFFLLNELLKPIIESKIYAKISDFVNTNHKIKVHTYTLPFNL